MQISDNEIYLLIKYTKSVLWRVAKCLSYIEEARCLKINSISALRTVNCVKKRGAQWRMRPLSLALAQDSVCCVVSDSNTCGVGTSCVPSHSGGEGVCCVHPCPAASHVSCKSNQNTDGVKRPSQQTNKQSLFYLTTVFVKLPSLIRRACRLVGRVQCGNTISETTGSGNR